MAILRNQKYFARSFVFLLLSMPTIVFSQVRLGYSFQELTREFSKQVTTIVYVDKLPCLIVSSSNVDVLYYFDHRSFCRQTSISTKSLKIAHEIIDTYNKSYKKTSKNTWEMKSGEKFPHIEYKIVQGTNHTFTWN